MAPKKAPKVEWAMIPGSPEYIYAGYNENNNFVIKQTLHRSNVPAEVLEMIESNGGSSNPAFLKNMNASVGNTDGNNDNQKIAPKLKMLTVVNNAESSIGGEALMGGKTKTPTKKKRTASTTPRTRRASSKSH